MLIRRSSLFFALGLGAALLMAPEPDPAAGGGGGSGGGPAPRTGRGEYDHDYVHGLREEAKGHRTAAEKAAAEKAAADAEVAKAKTEAAEAAKSAKKEADQRVIRVELKALAMAAGIVDVDGLKLVDTSKLKLDDAGNLVGGAELIEELKTSKPYLFGTANTTSTGKKPAAGEPGPKKAMDMSPEELKAAKRALGLKA